MLSAFVCANKSFISEIKNTISEVVIVKRCSNIVPNCINILRFDPQTFLILTFCFTAREAAIWELEKQQLHEKHQLAKSQLKDMFFLKRHQMLNRHQKV